MASFYQPCAAGIHTPNSCSEKENIEETRIHIVEFTDVVSV